MATNRRAPTLLLALALALGGLAHANDPHASTPGYPWDVPVNLNTGIDGLPLPSVLTLLAESVGLKPILEGVPAITVDYALENHRPFGQLWVLITSLHDLDSLLLDGNIIVVAPTGELDEIANATQPAETHAEAAGETDATTDEARPELSHRFFPLPADAEALVAALRTRYPDAEPIALPAANSLLVLAPEADHPAIEAFILDYQTQVGLATLDAPAPEPEPELTVAYYPVTHDMNDLIALLADQHPSSTVTPMPGSGLVAVLTTAAEHAQIAEKLNRLASAAIATRPGARRTFHQINYADPETLVEVLRGALGGGEDLTSRILFDPTSRTLVLTGDDNFQLEAQRMVERLDRELAQVTVTVRFQEVATSATERLGINLASGLGLLSMSISDGLSFVLNPLGSALTSFNIGATLDVLEAQSLSRTVNEATLTLTSGTTGKFTSGGRLDLVLAGDEGDDLRTVEYGTLLDVTPVVASDGRITLALRVGVTGFEGELQNIAGIQLTSRDLETTVTTADGQALVLGGLLERAIEVRESGVPILKDIPLLGFLFRTTSTTDRHGDLLVVVTANITPNESGTPIAAAP